ncbi:MAG: hypothetical protein L0099_11225 [Acidobacteria bacterium]|nr:hypothetical protein [Acidobacteriota bacterium]
MTRGPASRPARNPTFVAAAVTQALLALYLQVIEWVDLFPWNNVRGGNGQEAFDVSMAVVQSGLVVAAWKGMRPSLAVGAALYSVWLVLQIRAWWLPYFWGATEQRMQHYTRWFGETYKFLPPIGDHPIPDAAHVVLQLLIVAALAACLVNMRGEPLPN